jgi:predicted peptidase
MRFLAMWCVILQSLFPWFLAGCTKDNPPEKRKVYDEELLALFEASVFQSQEFKYPLPYRLFVPADYDEINKVPLVLYLHSSGGRGDNNKAQVEFGASRLVAPSTQAIESCFVLAPQCRVDRQWVNTKFRNTPFKNYNQDKIPESDSMKMVIEVLDMIIGKYNIDPARIYVCGSSMGASGTWDIITRHPDHFAAAYTCSGVSDPQKAHMLAKLPVWAFHGEKDQVSDVNNTRNMVREVKRYNPDCRYTEYPGAGHGISRMVYEEQELFPWLFSQVRN